MDGEGQDRVVGGRYRLVERLGAGAMGAVWRAEDTVLGRMVAVKEVVFPPGTRPEEQEVLRERTRREARSAARLDHPSAVTVYDVVEEHGRPWLVMELMEARTLADVVASEGPLTPAQVAQIGLSVLGALEAAHRQGIVHRDVKPGNVMLTDTGRVVLTDFGIATSADDASLTGTGLLLGSPAYIAPERARGNAPGPASDLWSLGATMFTAVEGRPPYDGADALETVTAVVTGEHAPFVAAGPLAEVLDALLEKDPQQRLDATGARRMLSAVSGAPVLPTPPPQPAPAQTDAGTAALHVGEVREHAGLDTAPHRLPPLERPAPRPPVDRPPLDRPPLPVPPRPVGSRLPRDRQRWRGATGPLVAAGALLALAAGGLAYSLASSDDGGPRNAGPTTTVAAPTTPAVAIPSNWVTYLDTAGWSVRVPPSFARSTTKLDEVQFKDPDTRATLRIKQVTPAPASAAALGDGRESVLSTLGGYAELSRQPGRLGELVTSDLELTFFSQVDLRALDRSLVVGGAGYTLYWQTPESAWQANRALFDTVLSTFRPET